MAEYLLKQLHFMTHEFVVPAKFVNRALVYLYLCIIAEDVGIECQAVDL